MTVTGRDNRIDRIIESRESCNPVEYTFRQDNRMDGMSQSSESCNPVEYSF